MKISIIAVGKIKENYLKEAIGEYLKRLSPYASVDIIEVPDEKCPQNLSAAQKKETLEREGEKILAKIPKNAFVYSLAIEGEKLSSQNFSRQIEKNAVKGQGSSVFVIGGSLGLCDKVKEKSDFLLSFSDMTFPHQITRFLLLEQIYRCFKIMQNAPYHK